LLPVTINTPFFDEARTKLGIKPVAPPPIYQPSVVSEAIFHAAAPTLPAAQKVGEDAPEVKLSDLEGNTVELADFRGQQTLVHFWNPGCGFCQ
jgi:thiol-disulfide isomerase/thioredoxin